MHLNILKLSAQFEALTTAQADEVLNHLEECFECQQEVTECGDPLLIDIMGPRYKHNVPIDIFLGRFKGADLYFLNDHVIARTSDDKYVFAAYQVPWDDSLKEASRRAEMKGLVKNVVCLRMD